VTVRARLALLTDRARVRVRRGVRVWITTPARDQTVAAGSRVHVSGWAFSDADEIDRVEIRWDGVDPVSAKHGQARPDIARHFPRIASAATSGYTASLPPAPADAKDTVIVVAAIDRGGRRAEARRHVSVTGPSTATDGATRRAVEAALPPGVTIFIHIPKAAGTSVRRVLEDAIPGDLRQNVYPDAEGISVDEFAELSSAERERLRFVMGHFGYGIHEQLAEPWRYVTMLRDPVDRYISSYHHALRFPGTPRQQEIANGKLSLEQALDAHLLPENLMVRLLSGTRKSLRQQDPGMLDEARHNVAEHFAAVLVMEEMDASMKRLETVLGIPLGEPSRLNRGPRSAAGESPELRAAIAEANALDVALYAEVRATAA
jgi:hypothetical protein